MLNRKCKIGTSIVLIMAFAGLSGCSVFSKAGKSVRNMTTFGNNTVGTDDTLVIPPSLRQPGTRHSTTASRQAPAQRKTTAVSTNKAIYKPSKNYYIVVGTYADQGQALDMFTRISSIGIKPTMESRVAKAGNRLHMVRLGPYTNQEDIDKAKDNLTSTGLSQFKVVAN